MTRKPEPSAPAPALTWTLRSKGQGLSFSLALSLSVIVCLSRFARLSANSLALDLLLVFYRHFKYFIFLDCRNFTSHAFFNNPTRKTARDNFRHTKRVNIYEAMRHDQQLTPYPLPTLDLMLLSAMAAQLVALFWFSVSQLAFVFERGLVIYEQRSLMRIFWLSPVA